VPLCPKHGQGYVSSYVSDWEAAYSKVVAFVDNARDAIRKAGISETDLGSW
jgi:hypothetical protein